MLPETVYGDVVVCGGGPTGIMAAISAARMGARTILVERNGFLGGMATGALVGPISNFMFNGELIIGGIPWEFIENLSKNKGAIINDSGNVPFDPEIYKFIAEEMVSSAGVTLMLYSLVTGVSTKEDGRITKVTVENKGGSQNIEAKYIIDCTGDADVIERAGLPFRLGDSLQPVTLVFRLGGVDTEAIDPLYLGVQDQGGFNVECRNALQKAEESGLDLPIFGGPWVLHGSTLRPGEVMVNMTRRSCNSVNPHELTEAQVGLRKEMFELVNYLRGAVKALENAFILDSGSTLGIRESRIIDGLYELTRDDILEPVDFPDSVGLGSHPIDIHSSADDKQALTWLKKPYRIPYRVLVPKDAKNILAAGRSISASTEAFASSRVQATCMALGQAAGVASALCLAQGIDFPELDGEHLRSVLNSQGAIT